MREEIQWLRDRIDYLERESIGQSNALYELMNTIDAKEWAHPKSCVHNSDPWDVWS
jgi:hypothetical protein